MQLFSPSLAAASASMRPSWPPPTIPTVLPGASGLSKLFMTSLWLLGDGAGLFGAPGIQALFHTRIGQTQNGGGMQRSILGAGLADGEGRHRHAARHLGNGEQRVQ